MPEERDWDLMKPAYERGLAMPSGRQEGWQEPERPAGDEHGLLQPTASHPSGVVLSAWLRETRQLRADLLARIHVNSHGFFEQLIIDVLLRMGYASRRRDLSGRLGRTGDGGIDGIITRDELGLDVILVQAKRLRPGTTVPVSHVRDFAGSLEARRANKGIFVTTARFSDAAHDFVAAVSRRVVLLNGDQLADIMIRHNIGVCVRETYQFKELDKGYFRQTA